MVASGEGRMNFGTWKASTRTCQSTITARCTIRMIAKDRTDPSVAAEHRTLLVDARRLLGRAAAIYRGFLQ